MTWPAARPWLGTIARLVLGVVWVWAAWSKIRAPRTFTQAVRAYDATPEWLSKGIGYGLPVLELSLGVLLILGLVTRIAAATSGVLFVVFLIGLIQASVRGIKLECGCFGGGGATGGGDTQYTLDILRDLALLVLAAYLVVWAATKLSTDAFIARNDAVEPPSAKRLRTEQGRRKYEAQLAVRRARASSRSRWLDGSLAGVVILVVLIGIGVQSSRAKIEGSLTATNATVANGVVFGKAAAATVDVYEDFQCPICLQFEKSVATTLDKDVRANKAQVRFHMISILDRSSSGNRYSSRAANAALCASDISVDRFVAFHNILYGDVGGKQVQPAEGSNGRTNAQLVSYAKASGITGSALTTFQGCVSNENHKALVEALTERASEKGVTGTPTVKVNGKSINATLAGFNAAIAKALTSGPAPKPSVTPAPKPSSSATVTPKPSTSTAPKPSATTAVKPSATTAAKPSATPTG